MEDEAVAAALTRQIDQEIMDGLLALICMSQFIQLLEVMELHSYGTDIPQ
jgi:hypothetical protein